jgi:hypothetical protein
VTPPSISASPGLNRVLHQPLSIPLHRSPPRHTSPGISQNTVFAKHRFRKTRFLPSTCVFGGHFPTIDKTPILPPRASRRAPSGRGAPVLNITATGRRGYRLRRRAPGHGGIPITGLIPPAQPPCRARCVLFGAGGDPRLGPDLPVDREPKRPGGARQSPRRHAPAHGLHVVRLQ